MSELIGQARFVSEELMSRGYPHDWNSSTVERIGLTDGKNNFVEEKILTFQGMSSQERKQHLGINKNFYMILEYVNGTTIYEIGDAGETADAMVQIVRVGVYNNQFVKLKVRLWEYIN